MGRKAFVFDVAKCSGCYCCQLACKDEHCGNDFTPIAAPQPDIGQFWIKVKDYVNGTAPKVAVHYVPEMCNHCEKCSLLAIAKDGDVYRREDGLVTISTVREAGAHRITVRDNGVGFDPKHQQDESHIGLQNVKERVERMCGGTAIVESEMGAGTVVTLLIPATSQNGMKEQGQ